MVWDYGSTKPPSTQPSSVSTPKVSAPAAGEMTLRAASKQFGVSVSTLQSWCRKGLVGARKLEGRWFAQPADIERRVHLLSGPSSVPQPPTPQPAERPAQPTAGDSLLVPRDAWDKMVSQLGNLHEAGQQLAEARERAVKAETEVRFLRERLSELRSGEAPTTTSTEDTKPPVDVSDAPASVADRAKRLWKSLRNR